MAIDKGNTNAMNRYVSMLYEGNGILFNKMSADKRNIEAMNNYASMLEKGDGIQCNIEEATKYFDMDKINKFV